MLEALHGTYYIYQSLSKNHIAHTLCPKQKKIMDSMTCEATFSYWQVFAKKLKLKILNITKWSDFWDFH